MQVSPLRATHLCGGVVLVLPAESDFDLSGRLSPSCGCCLRASRLSVNTGPRGLSTTWCRFTVSTCSSEAIKHITWTYIYSCNLLPLIASYRLSPVCICESSKLSSSFSPSAANKYCPLLIKEGGIRLLEKVLELESSQPETKDMARYHQVLSSLVFLHANW